MVMFPFSTTCLAVSGVVSWVQCAPPTQHLAIRREHLRAQDYVDHTPLVLQRDERRAPRRRRTLPGNDHPAHAQLRPAILT